MRSTRLAVLCCSWLVLCFGRAHAAPGASAQPKDLEFTAALDGTTQQYMEILPSDFDPTEPHHVMIALHGHGSNRAQYVREGRGECKAARDLAAQHHMIFVSPDYRGMTSWMGPAAEADVVQLIGDLKKQYKVGKVFLVGASMGGTSVLIFTARHPELIDGVSSQNGTANMVDYTSFLEAIQVSYGGSKAQKPDEYRSRSAEYFPERFVMPISFTTGGRDTVVPPASTLRLSAAIKKFNPNVLHIHRETGGHVTDYEDTAAAIDYVVRAVLKLPAAASQPSGAH